MWDGAGGRRGLGGWRGERWRTEQAGGAGWAGLESWTVPGSWTMRGQQERLIKAPVMQRWMTGNG